MSDFDNLSTASSRKNSIHVSGGGGGGTTADTVSLESSNLNHSTNEHHSVKPEKLIQDYVKLRSKLTILKKAYVELSESSSQKDQSIRKYEQEIEGLNFRNQQLTSRVEMLQKDLDSYVAAQSVSANSVASTNGLTSSQSSSNLLASSSSSSASSASSSQTKSPKLEVIAEELQHKINENTSLHRRLNELELDFRQKLSRNEQQLKQIESEKLLLEKKLETLETNSKAQIEKLQNDKIKLELTIIQLENQLRASHQEIISKESEFKKENEELILKQQKLIEQQQPQLHRSHSSSSLSSIGTTISSSTRKLHVETSTEDILIGCFKNQLDCLAKMFFYVNERSIGKKSLETTDNTGKYANRCEQILSQQIVPLFDAKFKPNNSLNNNQKLNHDLNKSINDFFEFVRNLFQSLISDISASNTNNEEMDTLNKKLKIYLNKLNQLVFETSDSNFSTILKDLILSSSLNSQINSKFSIGLTTLNDILDKILFVYNEKLSLEYTLDYASDLTTIDECLVSFLTQFKQLNTQISTTVQSSNTSILEIVTNIRTKYTNDNSESASFSINDSEIENLKSTIQAKDAELKQITEKMEQLKEKSIKDLNETQQLKERLSQLQGQLLQLQQKDQQQASEIENMKKLLDEENNKKVQIVEVKDEKPIEINEEKQLEDFTSEIYLKQIENLNKKIQFLDSKAMYYYEEMKSMLERLRLQIDVNNVQENEINEIKDQLERTRSSYETQMSTMSDHLIEMSDRISRQADENEKLSHELAGYKSTTAVSQQTSGGGGGGGFFSSNKNNNKNKKAK